MANVSAWILSRVDEALGLEEIKHFLENLQ